MVNSSGVRKRGHTWSARFRDSSGREREKGGFPKKRDALNWRAEQLVLVQRNAWQSPTRIDLSAYAAQWLNTHSVSAKTRLNYESSLRVHILPALGTRTLSRLARPDIKSWVEEMAQASVGTAALRRAFTVLRIMVREAQRDGLLLVDPTSGVRLPAAKRPQRNALSSNEVARLLGELPDESARLMTASMCSGGLRWGEISALRVKDVRLQDGLVALQVQRAFTEVNGSLYEVPPKGGRTREVLLPPSLSVPFQNVISSKELEDLVFSTSRKTPLDRSNWSRMVLQPAARRALGRSIRIHELRHTAASLMMSTGTPVLVTSQQLGHANPATTLNVYGHFYREDQILAVNRLDSLLAWPGFDSAPEPNSS